jgi:hypothetical protein
MQEYLSSDPILWVHSATLLKFIRRRMLELKNVQLRLSRIQPSNYATLSCLIMHLIRAVPCNPLPKLGFLHDLLVDLQFGPVAERFGIFFIHNIDLPSGVIRGIDVDDSAEAKQIMKHVTKVQPTRLVNSCPTAMFPLGNAPCWSEVVKTISYDPELLIEEWTWHDGWADDYHACKLFIQFTVDMWLSVNPNVLTTDTPHPTTLKDAMETWTVRSLRKTFSHCTFIPSNYKLRGHIHGRRTKGLPDMLDVFFPLPNNQVREGSVWMPFIRCGFIKEYHRVYMEFGNHRHKHLRHRLTMIFEGLQCLPMSLPSGGKSRGKVWDVLRGSVRFMTNPTYYRLEEIGPPPHRIRRQGIKVKANAATIEARLAEEHVGVPFQVTIQKNRQRRRAQKKTARSKKRAPTPPPHIPQALNLDTQSPSSSPGPHNSPTPTETTDHSMHPSLSQHVGATSQVKRQAKRILHRSLLSNSSPQKSPSPANTTHLSTHLIAANQPRRQSKRILERFVDSLINEWD